MSGLSPASLIALQSYGAAATQRHQNKPEPQQRQVKEAEPPRVAVSDKVTLQAAVKSAAGTQKAESPQPQPKRDDGVGRREAVNPDKPAYKRPGSLVDLKA